MDTTPSFDIAASDATEKLLECDIVLLPDTTLAEQSLLFSAAAADKGTFFTLTKQTCVPHLSLYMTQIAVADAPAVLCVAAAANNRQPRCPGAPGGGALQPGLWLF